MEEVEKFFLKKMSETYHMSLNLPSTSKTFSLFKRTTQVVFRTEVQDRSFQRRIVII
jgi:hypothetical protein